VVCCTLIVVQTSVHRSACNTQATLHRQAGTDNQKVRENVGSVVLGREEVRSETARTSDMTRC
jgi:hypothetical protein